MIKIDAVSTSGAQTDVASFSFNHTVGAGANRILVLSYASEDAGGKHEVNGITFNSVALTRAVYKRDGSDTKSAEIWYLLAPSVGTHAIAVDTADSVNSCNCGAVSAFGVSALYDTDTDTSATDAPSLDLVTDKASLLVDAFSSDRTSDLTPGTGQTALYQSAKGGGESGRNGGSYKVSASAGANTMTWTGAGAQESCAASFSQIDDGGSFIFNLL